MNGIISLIIGLLAGGALLFLYLKFTSNTKLLNASSEAEKLVSDANKEAETLRKEQLIEAEEEIFNLRQQAEEESERLLAKANEARRKLDEREAEVDLKIAVAEQQEKDNFATEKELQEKEKQLQANRVELQQIMRAQISKLEEISGFTREDAKRVLLRDLEADAHEEGRRLTSQIIEQSKLEANRKAREIVVQAIQQLAAEQSVEATVSVVMLPGDDMKGRIIGREGRNIRAFELATGVDVIIDDTPEIVVVSSYNSYRREIAKLALEKLISDGRIHPARIEEVVEKTTEELRTSLQEIGEQAMMDVGIHGAATELIEHLGKLRYRTSYGQNVLNHSTEVANLCGIMAAELGLEVKLAKRAGLFHDIGKAIDFNSESDHATTGADFLKKVNEHPIVVNAAGAHHSERDVSNPITALVMAADTISGTRPGARRESLESFIKRMEHLEQIAKHFQGVETSYAIQAGREIRVIAETARIDDNQARHLAREIAREVQKQVEFPGSIKVTVIREYRAFDFAT